MDIYVRDKMEQGSVLPLSIGPFCPNYVPFIEGGGGRSTHHFEYGYETGISYLHKLVHIYKSTFSTFKPGFITITIPVLPH